MDLMDQVSLVDPEMRIRFTSPHPKDFPDEVCTPLPPRSIIHGTTSGLLACSSVWLTFFLVCSEHAISPSFRSDKIELLFFAQLLHLIASRPNICKGIHMPAQSGSTTVLSRMRRNYTREAYLDLAARMKEIIPGLLVQGEEFPYSFSSVECRFPLRAFQHNHDRGSHQERLH